MKGVRTDMENNHDTSEFVHSIISKLSKLNYIKPAEIPNIDLYMDQVTTFMDSHLSDGKRHSEDKILTKTMINNYAKNDLLPPPIKKKYSKDHILVLIFIYYFKNLMSISDIQTLLNPLTNRFFDNEDTISLENIYKEVYRLEREQVADISRSISKQFNISEESFNNVKNKDDKEYLQTFTFIALLSFDIFMKKSVIEALVDDLKEKENAKAATEQAKSSKNAKKEKDN